MPIEITLEADARLNRECVKEVLVACGVSNFLEIKESLTADFPDSNMSLFLRDNLKNSNLLTEEMEWVDWFVGMRLTFRYSIINYDNCNIDLRQFLDKLTEFSDAYFVVAFQYEKVLAMRDGHGLKILAGMERNNN